MTALDRWEKEYSFHMVIDRKPGDDQYDRFKEELKKHGIICMLMGSSVGFKTQEELNIAKLIY